MIRRTLKRAAYRSGLLAALHRARNRSHLTIVMFHRVLSPDDPRWKIADPSYTVSTSLFDQCLRFFRQHYNTVDLETVVGARRGSTSLPVRPLLITFDDGWADTEEYALPALRQHGLPAAVFVIAAGVDRHRPFWQDALVAEWRSGRLDRQRLTRLSGMAGIAALAESPAIATIDALTEGLEQADEREVERELAFRDSEKPEMLTKVQLAALQSARIAIGAHGVTHRPLTRSRDQRGELESSRRMLAELIGQAPARGPVAVSFPHGRYDETTIRCARDVGFQVMLTSDPCLNLTRSGGCSELLGRLEIPAHEITDGCGRLRPELLALWLFTRPAARLESFAAGRTGAPA